MDLGLHGRTVIVTGASGGLGRAIARGFAAEGAEVVLTYHGNRSAVEKLAGEIGDRAFVIRYDMGADDAAQELVRAVLDRTGRIDVLVNNAVRWGSSTPDPDARFESAPDSDWLAMLRTNVEGPLRLSRAVAPAMRARGWGRLVHISSSLAVDGAAGSEYYAAAKAALHGFSRSAAFGLGRSGDVLSNVVMPGLTRTHTNGAIVDAAGDHYAALSPVRRLLDADEVAGPVVYLGSAANTGITGQVVAVTGGA
jgi:3-oxoacyl-[acyl-carrier protein] reductase